MNNDSAHTEKQDAVLPEGWYPDQAQIGFERRWDGAAWTSDTRPVENKGENDAVGVPDGPTAGTTSARTRLIGWVRRNRILAIAVGAALAVLVTAAILMPGLLGGRQQVQGVLILSGEVGNVEGSWDSCGGTGGYSDVSAGAASTVRDGDGAIVGTLEVENMSTEKLRHFIEADDQYSLGWGANGEYDTTYELLKTGAELKYSCWLYVSGEVNSAEFYTIEIGKRGGLSYSKDQLSGHGWWFTMSLGS